MNALDCEGPRDRPVFVVGVGRSGTSLVQSILASHSQLAFPPETGFMRRYLAGNVLARRFRRDGVAAVVAALRQDRVLQRLGAVLDRLLHELETGGVAPADVAVFDAIMRFHAERVQKVRVGDKDPRAVEFLRLIARYWPNAYVVHVVRDPRDVMASKQKAEWSTDKPFIRHVFASATQFAIALRCGRKRFKDRYIEIHYERLLANPVGEVDRLCQRLDLPFEGDMLEFQDVARQLVSREELSWKKETLGPLLAANTGKWTSVLTAFNTALSERVCREAMAAGGYPASDAINTLGPASRLAVGALAAGLCATVPLYVVYRTLSMRLRHP